MSPHLTIPMNYQKSLVLYRSSLRTVEGRPQWSIMFDPSEIVGVAEYDMPDDAVTRIFRIYLKNGGVIDAVPFGELVCLDAKGQLHSALISCVRELSDLLYGFELIPKIHGTVSIAK